MIAKGPSWPDQAKFSGSVQTTFGLTEPSSRHLPTAQFEEFLGSGLNLKDIHIFRLDQPMLLCLVCCLSYLDPSLASPIHLGLAWFSRHSAFCLASPSQSGLVASLSKTSVQQTYSSSSGLVFKAFSLPFGQPIALVFLASALSLFG